MMELEYGGAFLRELEGGLEEKDAYGFADGDIGLLQCYSAKITDVQGKNFKKVDRSDSNSIGEYLCRQSDCEQSEIMEEGDMEQAVLEDDQEDDLSMAEFRDGRDYLQWLDRRLPYLQTFEPDDKVHYFFFQSWSKETYYPEMESLIEEMEEEGIDEDVENIVNKEENVWEEGTKPEFKDGRQLVEWLGRKLPYLEPFAPDDAVHYCFCREWSKDQFQPRLDLLVEEDMEAITEEEYMEGIIPEECMGGTIHDKSMEKSIDDESMEGIIDDEIMEETIHDEIMEGTMKEEGGVETFQVEDTQRTAQYVEEENDEEENEDHPYIRMMRSPLVLEGFLLKNKEDTLNIRKEGKELVNEAGTSSALLSDDKKERRTGADQMQKKRPINTRVTKTNKEHDDNPMLKDPPKSLESKEWDDFGFR